MKVAVLDDWQQVARDCADWSELERRARIDVFHDRLGDEDSIAETLKDHDVILALRERTAFPASLVRRLPNLRMFSMGGARAGSIAIDAMIRQGVTVCATVGGPSGTATAELALGLMIAAARTIPQGDRAVRTGAFQTGTQPGMVLQGKTLGIVGLGRIGGRMAAFGKALGMEVVAWSQNLTPGRAAEHGARYVTKSELFAIADAVSLHLPHSERSHHICGPAEIEAMKPGAILINTARAGLVDMAALVPAARRGHVRVAFDVYDIEPLPRDHPLTALPDAVLTPHFGYDTREALREFYTQMIENTLAFADGAPIRVIHAER